MSIWQLLAVVIGIVGALLGVYFRESVRKAHRQKEVAALIEAQVIDIIRQLLRTEVKEILFLGERWRDDRLKALKAEGSSGYARVDEEYQAKLAKARESFLQDGELLRTAEELHQTFRNMPERVFNYAVEQLQIARDNVISGASLVSDRVAAELSWDCAGSVVQIRNALIELFHHNISAMLIQRETKRFDASVLRDPVFSIAELSLRACMLLEPLRARASRIRKRSLLRLAISNMFA